MAEERPLVTIYLPMEATTFAQLLLKIGQVFPDAEIRAEHDDSSVCNLYEGSASVSDDSLRDE